MGVVFHSLPSFSLASQQPKISIVQVNAYLCYIIKDFNTDPLSATLIVLLPVNLFYI